MMQLLLLGWGWAAHVAASPGMGAGCARLPLLGHGQATRGATAPQTGADCVRLPLLGLVQAARGVAAPWMVAGRVRLLLLRQGQAELAFIFMSIIYFVILFAFGIQVQFILKMEHMKFAFKSL